MKFAVGLLAVMWAVFFLDWAVQAVDLNQYGLVPRTLMGAIGIVTMPFLHGNFAHLLGNSIPLFILLVLMAASQKHSEALVAGIALLGGILLWIFGRHVIHIGASGLVYGLIGFLLVAGVVQKKPLAIVVALVVGFLYGGTLLWGVLPGKPGISWDGHLFGALAGGLSAKFGSPAEDQKQALIG